jgi:hypothetical protein
VSAPKVDVLAVLDRLWNRISFHNVDQIALANELAKARSAVAELIDDADRMAKWIVNRGQDLRDHACRECVGTGDLVVDGFRCGYHAAFARIGGAA